MRPGHSVLAGWLSLALGGSAFAQSPGAAVPPPAGPLAVPYLAQSELLCGGAAVAMVERWWGRRRVYAEDFAALVRPERGGIVTGELADAVRRRGWDAQVFAGSPREVRRRIEAGVPVVALISVGRNRFHYVVVVSWRDGEVVYHDPARAPGIRRPEAEFVADWSVADRWTMVMIPTATPPAPAGDAVKPAPEPAGLPCPPWLDRAADSAGTGAVGAAGRMIDEAARLCPDEPLVLRERAALRFRERRYAEAAVLAEAYVARVPADEHGWGLLAATRYLAGNPEGALDAWNRIGRPTVDLVRVDGLRRLRFGPVARTIPVAPGDTLTSDRLALARRRMGELPGLSGSAVEYRPVEGELVELDARVAERPLLGRPLPLFASAAVRALAQDEARLDLVSPAGTGEVWTALWRWTSARPRVALRLEAPARVWIPGVAVVEGAWDRYRLPADSTHPLGSAQERRSAAFRFGAWITPAFRAVLGSRLDRWQGDTTLLASLAAVEARLAGDRLTLLASGEYATGLSPGPSHTIGSGLARWLSAPDLSRARWSVQAGLDVSSRSTPRGLWPVAGGEDWAIPLRAHGGTADGRLSARTTGRGMIHGGVEADHPLARLGPMVVAAGVFVDAARTLDPPAATAGRLYLDGGFGLRIGGAGVGSRIIRIDLATGLTERVTALTARVEAR